MGVAVGGGDAVSVAVGIGVVLGGTDVSVGRGAAVAVAVGGTGVWVNEGVRVAVAVGDTGVSVGIGRVAVGDVPAIGVGKGATVGVAARRHAASQPASPLRIKPTKVRRETDSIELDLFSKD